MLNGGGKLNALADAWPPGRVRMLQSSGVLVFDVDDTLLARQVSSGAGDQAYSDSPAAQQLPFLLSAGVRIGIITGHGWQQLKERLVDPLVNVVSAGGVSSRSELRNLFLYANRGATRGIYTDDGFVLDSGYGASCGIDPDDINRLRTLLLDLIADSESDLILNSRRYRRTFPDFPFSEFPPTVTNRENAILGLKPIPDALSLRETMLASGRQILGKLGLDSKYAIMAAGRSTIEISRLGLSKSIAYNDILQQVADRLRISPGTVESHSVFVGDEFSQNGNDVDLAEEFPNSLCLSVAPLGVPVSMHNVTCLCRLTDKSGPSATLALCNYVQNSLGKAPLIC